MLELVYLLFVFDSKSWPAKRTHPANTAASATERTLNTWKSLATGRTLERCLFIDNLIYFG